MPKSNLDSSTEIIHFATSTGAMGSVLVAQSAKGICAILLGDDPKVLAQDLQSRFKGSQCISGGDELKEHLEKVIFFVENPQTAMLLPLDIRGTEFQQHVWKALQQIAIGATASYTEIARALGKPKAFRAVAQACAANAIAVAIPCHRVVRSDGGLSGYRWGIERKRLLLQKEERPHIY
jgi:AraC family transcriptional regulator, regulatory protein of adaptative response / methylated-DNA-[protein]-cysteine methyltransferase